jgi:uncharacterized membrane protein
MAYELANTELVALIILAFSFVFWYTSRQKGCWYRRYMLPLMVASLAIILPGWLPKIAVLLSAAAIYEGYQGYGRAEKAKEEKPKE